MDQETTSLPRRVLVTGSAGAIGRVVAPALSQRGHFVRGYDLADSHGVDESHTGNLVDAGSVEMAIDGMDTILHLAAEPNEADFLTRLLEPNVIGLYNVFAGATKLGVKRIIIASSCQVVLNLETGGKPIRLEDGVAPPNHYALTKLWAEGMGEMYSRLYGMEVIAVRIGGFPRDRKGVERILSFNRQGLILSHDDAVRFFTCGIEVETLPTPFVILPAASKWPAAPFFDLEPARRIIGYEPQDIFPEGIPFLKELE